MEYASIPWSQKSGTATTKGKQKRGGEKALTFNLAVWFLHVLAASKSEPDWSYDLLKSEDLQLRECSFPRVPATPESEQGQGQRLDRSQARARSLSRKRAREDTGGSYIHSFTSDGSAFMGSFQVCPLALLTTPVKVALEHLLNNDSKSPRSRRSESASSDITASNERPRWVPNGDSFASSKGDEETGHAELRRSKRVRAEALKL